MISKEYRGLHQILIVLSVGVVMKTGKHKQHHLRRSSLSEFNFTGISKRGGIIDSIKSFFTGKKKKENLTGAFDTKQLRSQRPPVQRSTVQRSTAQLPGKANNSKANSAIALHSLDADSLANNIARFEGVNVKGSLAQRNFNPGNLKFRGQKGAIQGDKGFAKFKSMDEGYTALKGQIKLDTDRGLSLKGFTKKYAPPSENDTGAYYKFLRKNTQTK